MTSNIRIPKICEFCEKEFIAKTTSTKYCCHNCARQANRQRKRKEKIGEALKKTNNQKLFLETGVDIAKVKEKEFLSIKEAYTFLNLSERTFYRLLKSGRIKHTKLGNRTIIKRSDIDILFS